ncbi:PREDICTED: uncharacterized protein LOC105368697 [Ceratosolen solmsi marchali]|uniref:Uncharacterized protein LOC105368697 n=1 Tax=Ceratosolen solmsi marchali TaxID=326594 RepID=A0AAJ7E334_9HYME|nr:PREDICTED: uncharacterized protein LOC105368697 [Ceratosolen solmsi marchali]
MSVDLLSEPPQRKNFIKENVRNLRRMEQLFHSNSNNKSAKDLKLPVLKQRKFSSKFNGIGDSQIVNSNDALQELNTNKNVENEMPRLFNQKLFIEEQKNKKKTTRVLSNSKYISEKESRPFLNGKIKNHYCRNQVDSKSRNRHKLKAYSESNVIQQTLNEVVTKDEIDATSKSQGVQTLDENDLSSLYSEGIIRYPSGRTKEQQKSFTKSNETKVQETSNDVIKNTSNSVLTDKVDHVKASKERISLASKLVSQLNNGTVPPNYRVGVVPKYIKERKEALQKIEEAKAASKNVDCPSGHVPVPDNERKQTLSILKKNYQEFVNELNMLPIRTDTLRSHKRKMEIEKQLTKLEEAIKIFSRPKVFIKIDS